MKQSLIIKSILLIFTAMVSFNGFSQNAITADKLSQDWSLLTTKDGVEVYLKQEKCDVGAPDAFTYAFIRLVNTNTAEKSVEFNFQMIFDNNCYGCGDTRETKHMLAVPASTSVEGESTMKIGELALLINNPYQLESGTLESINMDVLNIK
ncbi:MAG: hypothetical protein ACJA0U_002061 [Salibacteraceae bacterium]|jgi:hypothetical protein